MGPAFFTKLIFFLMHDPKNPGNQGYIMDQWTGSSINLIFDNEPDDLVKLNKHKVKLNKNQISYFETVSDKNTPEDYENFCLHVEYMAKCLGKEPVEIELAMFSKGGLRKGEWRNFVIESRNN